MLLDAITIMIATGDMERSKYTISGEGLAKKFGRNALFRNINLALETGQSLSITGPNGSGKSTLLMILAGLLRPTAGSISLATTKAIEKSEWPLHIGYTGPLINPYDELTGMENISFAAMQGRDDSRALPLLEQFCLDRHRDKKVKHYSSGMKQRLKILLALLNDPPVLMLDEPGMNLDAGGTAVLHSCIQSVRNDKIIILATNDEKEEKLCSGVIRLG